MEFFENWCGVLVRDWFVGLLDLSKLIDVECVVLVGFLF